MKNTQIREGGTDAFTIILLNLVLCSPGFRHFFLRAHETQGVAGVEGPGRGGQASDVQDAASHGLLGALTRIPCLRHCLDKMSVRQCWTARQRSLAMEVP